ncbi:MAG: GntR family transcriptional regulator [Pseudoramibacter sp.]
MKSMKWHINVHQPIYPQLLRQMERRILAGEYAPGEKLKSVRDLAEEAGVNPNTMQRAMRDLEHSGLVHARRTLGRFVTEDTGLIAKNRNKLTGETIQTFLSQMAEMGFSSEEAVEQLRLYIQQTGGESEEETEGENHE